MVQAQTSVQYTPVQVLQAARRAEAEGKMDYALQFYRHIVEHHGVTEEAAAAREGLFRIAEWRWGEARIARRQEAAAAAARENEAPPPPAHEQSQPHFSLHEDTVEVPPLPNDDSRLPQIITRDASNDDDEVAHYRVAKVFAFVLSGLGWVGVLAGVALAVIAAANVVAEASAAALMGLPVGVVVGLPAVMLGMVLVVAGHLAVAVFESCNAAQERLELERARATS